jgi:hypothetical protein
VAAHASRRIRALKDRIIERQMIEMVIDWEIILVVFSHHGLY